MKVQRLSIDPCSARQAQAQHKRTQCGHFCNLRGHSAPLVKEITGVATEQGPPENMPAGTKGREGRGNSQPRTIIARSQASHDLHGPRTLSWSSPNSMPYTPPRNEREGRGSTEQQRRGRGRGNGEGEAAGTKGKREWEGVRDVDGWARWPGTDSPQRTLSLFPLTGPVSPRGKKA